MAEERRPVQIRVVGKPPDLPAAQLVKLTAALRPLIEQQRQITEALQPLMAVMQQMQEAIRPAAAVVAQFVEQNRPALLALADLAQRNRAVIEAMGTIRVGQTPVLVVPPDTYTRLRQFEIDLANNRPVTPEVMADLMLAFWALFASMSFTLVWLSSTELSPQQRLGLWASVVMGAAMAQAWRATRPPP